MWEYLIVTPAQRFSVGKGTVENEVTVALRYNCKKAFPGLPLKETTV